MTTKRLLTSNPAPSAARETVQPEPWWRFPIVWMVIAGPALVVVAGIVTAVIAWRGADPVLTVSAAPMSRAGEAPAMQGRNKAAENAVRPGGH